MSTYTISSTVTLETTDCTCGVTFAAPARLLASRRQDGKTFYCPNGHSLVYKDSDMEKAKKAAADAEERLRIARIAAAAARDQAAAAERSKANMKGQMTKLRKRAANGVCPCCTRSFVDLRRHMDTKHPDYAETAE